MLLLVSCQEELGLGKKKTHPNQIHPKIEIEIVSKFSFGKEISIYNGTRFKGLCSTILFLLIEKYEI